MIQFYAPDLTETLTLGAEETAHCVKVLRKKPGDHIFVTDGRGKRFDCIISEINKKGVSLEILSSEEIPKNWDFRIVLAVAPTKNADRMAWLVEKATEIGVDEIRFIDCRFSERKQVNIERLRRNAVSAMNQSLKTRLPEIIEIKPLSSIHSLKGEKFFGYCSREMERLEFSKEYVGCRDVVIAIGPEGDFSAEEVEKLIEVDFKAVTFGNERLRTETAALFAVAATHIINELKN